MDREEMHPSDAPEYLDAFEANAWADGYNACIAALRAAPARCDAPTAAAQFLLDRLDEYDPGDDEAEREYHGHIAPAIARLRSALAVPSAEREYEPGMNPIDDAEFGMKP